MSTTFSEFEEQLEDILTALKALAHPLRIQILCTLLDGPRSVSALVEATQGSQSQVSQFLKALRTEGIVSFEKNGTQCLYRIQDARIAKLVSKIKTIYCDSHY
jgi:DNA-binding transcriptional ArsR family regulator